MRITADGRLKSARMLGLAALVLAAVARTASGQGDAQAPPATGVGQWLYASGSIGVAILILSLAAIALSVEYALSVRRATLVPDELHLALEELLAEGRFEEARAVSADDGSFLGRVMAAGLARGTAGRQAALAAMEEVGRAETNRLYQRVGYLALIANVAPMLGLLGTVGGMMRSFDRIAGAGQPRVSELAGGIRFALVTTYLGLLVAIPTTILFVIFRNRVSRIAAEVAAVAEGLLNQAGRQARRRAAAKP